MRRYQEQQPHDRGCHWQGRQDHSCRVVAVLALTTACALSLFSGNRITSYIPLALPIFVQELVLAGWLIARGFDTTAPARPVLRGAALPPVAAPSAAGGAR